MKIDVASINEILHIINNEDKTIAFAIENEIPKIEKAVKLIVNAFQNGGRLIYVGAGTSGRLGVLDAAECVPTFGVNKNLISGIIAGGKNALIQSIEGAEDNEPQAKKDLSAKKISHKDVVCGIAASIRTPYVNSAIGFAKQKKAKIIFITTNSRKIYSQKHFSNLHKNVDIAICVDVGSEVITGSTRMKSGTAQKMVLNMLSTSSMIRIGKVYENIMVDLKLNNKKLTERAKKILITILNITYGEAESLLEEANGNVKVAIVMKKKNVSQKKAIELLKAANEFIRKIFYF